jgi:hypothetical protein
MHHFGPGSMGVSKFKGEDGNGDQIDLSIR